MRISVVIPICNERDNLLPLHEALQATLQRLGQTYEVVFVDDGSRDCSANVLERLAEQDPAVKVVQLRRNFGQTAALDAGIRASSGDVVVTMDGDLQNDPADIPRLLRKLEEGFDLVYGWRKNRVDDRLTRQVPSWWANRLTWLLTGFAGHDIGCTLKAMRRELALELPLYGESHRFIPVLAQCQGARSAEIVVRHHPRRFGRSKYGMSRTLGVLCDLISLWFWTRHGTRPMRLFGTWGLAGCGLGLAMAVGAIGRYLAGDSRLFCAAVGLLGLLSVVAGIQALGLGILAEILVRSRHEKTARGTYRIRRVLNGTVPQVGAMPQSAAIPTRERSESKR